MVQKNLVPGKGSKMTRGQSQSKFASNIHSIETKAHLHLGALLLLLVLLDDQELAGGEGKGRVVTLWDLRQRLLHLLPSLRMRRFFKQGNDIT